MFFTYLESLDYDVGTEIVLAQIFSLSASKFLTRHKTITKINFVMPEVGLYSLQKYSLCKPLSLQKV